tara:strand:- start:465 stop:707 length:243 start_codon:yes stop_codon:yes gene_type:complete
MDYNKEKELVLDCLREFDTEQEKVSETLFNIYPAEMNAIVRLVQKDLIAGVVKSYCKCSEPKPNYPELLWCKYCGDWIPE